MKKTKTIYVNRNKAFELSMQILQAIGSSEKEASIVAQHLVESNLKGHDSHGFGMLSRYVQSEKMTALRPNTDVKLMSDTGSILQFDGQRGFGQKVVLQALDKTIERCKDTGLCLMTVRNAHHMGRIGTYAEKVVAKKLTAIFFVNVVDHDELVAPHLGKAARLGTNPICIGLPATAENDPVIIDFATSVVAYGKTREYWLKGQRFDEKVMLDHEGKPTDDPCAMWEPPKGALRPIGGHKGFGLSLIADLLAGAFSQGATSQPENERLGGIVNNMMAIVFDPAKLGPSQAIQAEVDAMLAHITSCPSTDESDPVQIPGDFERNTYEQRSSQGIPVSNNAWQTLVNLLNEVAPDNAFNLED